MDRSAYDYAESVWMLIVAPLRGSLALTDLGMAVCVSMRHLSLLAPIRLMTGGDLKTIPRFSSGSVNSRPIIMRIGTTRSTFEINVCEALKKPRVAGLFYI